MTDKCNPTLNISSAHANGHKVRITPRQLRYGRTASRRGSGPVECSLER
jgi:hypothetical protein